MSNQTTYPRGGRQPRSFYSPQGSMSSADPAHFYPSIREMGPPAMNYRPQPVEIDLNNSLLNNSVLNSSRTLPSPSASAAAAWDPPSFSHDFGDIPTHGSSSVPRHTQMDSHSRGPTQEPIWQWYADNDGPWVPKGAISEIPAERQTRPRVGIHRMAMQYDTTYRQQNPSDAGTYPYGASPSDSGYGSHGARRSDGNASVFSGDIPDREDCQIIPSHLADFHASYQGMNEVLQQREAHSSEPWTLASIPRLDSQAPLICTGCNKAVKTKSELKKHDLRHTKPFKCNILRCPRTEGFSTRNDLERHTKSKHPSAVQGVESTKRYRCCFPGCRSKDKSWPRLDNFKSHLKRVHHLKEEEEFVEMIPRAEFWQSGSTNNDQDGPSPEKESCPALPQAMELDISQSNPELRISELNQKHIGYPAVIEPSHEDSAPTSPLENPKKTLALVQEEPLPDACQPTTVQLLEVLQAPPEDLRNQTVLNNLLAAPVSINESAAKKAPESRAITPHNVQTLKTATQGKGMKLEVSASDNVKITEALKTALGGAKPHGDNEDRALQQHLKRNTLPSDWSPSGDPWFPELNPALSPATSNGGANLTDSPPVQVDDEDLEQKAIEVLKTLQTLGYTIHKDPSHSPKPLQINPGSAASNKSENLVICVKCSKFRGRPCELKKHMKRHSKPYGCTFPTCSKTFGSKNDWKRHENSQHFHLETWRCEEEKLEGGACAKVCYRKQVFQDHLKKDHLISDEEAIKAKVEACRIGRNCQSRFWCGFCTKVIDLNKKGIDAWTERFDHIDDHFMGRRDMPKKDIQDWVPVDSSAKLREVRHVLDPSFRKDGEDFSSNSSSSGSPSESRSPPDPTGAGAGESSARAINVENGVVALKRKHSGSSNDSTRKVKKSRDYYTGEILVMCCQCDMAHNPKLSQSCTNCDDSHMFGTCCSSQHRSAATQDILPTTSVGFSSAERSSSSFH